MIKNFKSFLIEKNNNIYTGKEIADYVIDISEDSGAPDYFITKYILPNNFKLIKLNIDDILKKDPSFEEYFNHGEDRYADYTEDEYPHSDNLYNPIVIYNDIVLDGYNRMTMLYKLGEKTVDAYVNV